MLHLNTLLSGILKIHSYMILIYYTRMNNMAYDKIICIILFGLLRVLHTTPSSMFKTECHDRNFYVSIKSNFLGPKYRLDVQGGSVVRTVAGHWADECGYTLQVDSWGDLILRVSYLACLVENQGDSRFQLLLWFVSEVPDGEEPMPVTLSCTLKVPWSPREIICEENYMEVSVMKQVPSDHQRGMEWITPAPEPADGLREWRVLFRVPESCQQTSWAPLQEETIPVHLVHLLGYHINTTASRILLRSGYGSRLAYRLQEGDVMVEVVSASILYRHHWTLLRVDMSVACSMNWGREEGGKMRWILPLTLTSLMRPPLTHKGVKVGVGGHYLDACAASHQGYEIHYDNTTVDVHIPFGADGGRIKSGVAGGLYTQSYAVDMHLLYEWEDAEWNHTQHRTYRTLITPHHPHRIMITNQTVPSMGKFAVSVCCFLWDVALLNVSLAGRQLRVEEAELSGVHVSKVPFPNGTHLYLLQVPLTHPLVSQKYLGKGDRSFTLSVRFSFMLSPGGETFHQSATVHTRLQDVVLPHLEGECTASGVRILLHYGNMDSDWAMYVGGHRLDWDLVRSGRYTLNSYQGHFTVEVPFYAPGMDYRDLTVRGLVVSVSVSLVHLETLEIQEFLQQCELPVNELLVCLPDRRVVVLVDTAGTIPPVDPVHTALLDAACGPLETTPSRALFNFPAASCGSSVTHKGGQVIYTNEVRYIPPDPAHPKPHLPYSVPLMCVYLESSVRGPTIYQPRSVLPTDPTLSPPPPPLSLLTKSTERKKRALHAGG
ncbi:uncharacterized protein LOC143518632 isoform X2 [Brachyhypopomus gauderio]|uniref:uncharacterized protein LOC143518632 isoform X2 n=1 Tax=Brachyhypopomus gauderio TaxID=698409 RepID=UPI004043421F